MVFLSLWKQTLGLYLDLTTVVSFSIVFQFTAHM
jgi:hypothetical protein